ncbi:MAG: hypothetical protein MUC92_14065 [Fimbriimonadaceae bacterium]|jgi:hypothetical protein|nr:hypothetical protein [Fimbriimonadaceae bacterium]
MIKTWTMIAATTLLAGTAGAAGVPVGRLASLTGKVTIQFSGKGQARDLTQTDVKNGLRLVEGDVLTLYPSRGKPIPRVTITLNGKVVQTLATQNQTVSRTLRRVAPGESETQAQWQRKSQAMATARGTPTGIVTPQRGALVFPNELLIVLAPAVKLLGVRWESQESRPLAFQTQVPGVWKVFAPGSKQPFGGLHRITLLIETSLGKELLDFRLVDETDSARFTKRLAEAGQLEDPVSRLTARISAALEEGHWSLACVEASRLLEIQPQNAAAKEVLRIATSTQNWIGSYRQPYSRQ